LAGKPETAIVKVAEGRRMRRYLLGLMAVFLSEAASAQPIPAAPTPPSPPHVVVLPDWKRLPDLPVIWSVYPLGARRLNITGTTIMRCVVTRKGRLRDCKTISEAPPNFGFGAAEVALAPYFLMTPKMVDGKPVEAEITVPMRFDLK
jgi:TonB family protein